jgi:hypothetical protein
MEVNDHIHTPAAVPARESLQHPLKRGLVEPQPHSGRSVEDKVSFHCWKSNRDPSVFQAVG